MADIMRVKSLAGSYLANAEDSATGKTVTRITYNKGATWWPLAAPDNARYLLDL
jgi:hypothetical protein